MVPGSHFQVLGVRFPCPRVASPSLRVPGPRVLGPRVLGHGSWVSSPRVMGLGSHVSESQVLGLGSQGHWFCISGPRSHDPGSQVLILDDSHIRNRIKKQALCENKLFRNIVSYFPPFTSTVTHLSLLLSFLFPKTVFIKDCSF